MGSEQRCSNWVIHNQRTTAISLLQSQHLSLSNFICNKFYVVKSDFVSICCPFLLLSPSQVFRVSILAPSPLLPFLAITWRGGDYNFADVTVIFQSSNRRCPRFFLGLRTQRDGIFRWSSNPNWLLSWVFISVSSLARDSQIFFFYRCWHSASLKPLRHFWEFPCGFLLPLSLSQGKMAEGVCLFEGENEK